MHMNMESSPRVLTMTLQWLVTLGGGKKRQKYKFGNIKDQLCLLAVAAQSLSIEGMLLPGW